MPPVQGAWVRSIDRWMDKEALVHIDDEILPSYKKEQMWNSWTEVDKPRMK